MREMRLPCETIARQVLPVFRCLVAKELVEKCHYTQVEAARTLGTTQAAISQYIRSKRGYKGIGRFEASKPTVQDAANETAKRIAAEETSIDEVIATFCRLYKSLRKEAKTFR